MRLTDVGGRAPVLQVTITLSGDVTGNTDRGTTVSDTRAESADVTGLVCTSETLLVVFSVDGDVLVVLLSELFDGSLNVLHTTLRTHSSGTVVGVAACTVPIARYGLGAEGDLDTPLLGKTDEEVTGHPEMITHLNALARPNLELPLGRHDLGIDPANLDTRVQTDTVVGFNQVTCENLSSA